MGNQRIRKVTMSTATITTRYIIFPFLFLSLLTYLSASPTVLPTPTPSGFPSLSPSTFYLITTIAGSSTSGSYSGDSAAATSATLYSPYSVTLDTSGITSTLLLRDFNLLTYYYLLSSTQVTCISQISTTIVSAR